MSTSAAASTIAAVVVGFALVVALPSAASAAGFSGPQCLFGVESPTTIVSRIHYSCSGLSVGDQGVDIQVSDAHSNFLAFMVPAPGVDQAVFGPDAAALFTVSEQVGPDGGGAFSGTITNAGAWAGGIAFDGPSVDRASDVTVVSGCTGTAESCTFTSVDPSGTNTDGGLAEFSGGAPADPSAASIVGDAAGTLVSFVLSVAQSVWPIWVVVCAVLLGVGLFRKVAKA